MVTLSIIVMLLVGAVHAQAGEVGSGKEGVMAYWKERVQGAPSMSSGLQGMVTPLTAPQEKALHEQLVQQADFLPAHAPAFCQAAHLVCNLRSYLMVSTNVYHYPPSSKPQPGGFFRQSPVTERPQPGGFFRQSLTLVAGAKIKVQDDAIKATKKQAFLPRELAKLFPISGQNAIPKMTKMLGIPKSAIPSMEDTVANCAQSTSLPGEIKACLSSIEALADFVSSIMASSQPIDILDMMSPIAPNITPNAIHTIVAVKTIQQDPNSKYLACHDVLFPFRLFLCHYIDQTRLFLATLQVQDGTKYNRVAVCHYDTSSWDPNHVSFSDTHTKPGESEVCHWMRKDGIVFLHSS